MTSQRDEATRQPAGEGMTDDPIVIERRDEILAGDDPADEGPGPAAGHGTGYDRPGYERAGLGRPEYEGPGDEGPRGAGNRGAGNSGAGNSGADPRGEGPGADGTGEDLTASDEMVGRHAAPDAGADPAPLVVPPEGPSPDMGVSPASASAPSGPAVSGPAAVSGAAESLAQPGVAGMPDPAVSAPPGDGRGPASGSPGVGLPAAALSEQQWPAIQAMFVDDPRGSVQRAAAAADEVLKALVASLEREQAALRTSWENGGDSTTEDLRTALQQYRAFCGRLEGLA
jgi:hypothetical protein